MLSSDTVSHTRRRSMGALLKNYLAPVSGAGRQGPAPRRITLLSIWDQPRSESGRTDDARLFPAEERYTFRSRTRLRRAGLARGDAKRAFTCPALFRGNPVPSEHGIARLAGRDRSSSVALASRDRLDPLRYQDRTVPRVRTPHLIHSVLAWCLGSESN